MGWMASDSRVEGMSFEALLVLSVRRLFILSDIGDGDGDGKV